MSVIEEITYETSVHLFSPAQKCHLQFLVIVIIDHLWSKLMSLSKFTTLLVVVDTCLAAYKRNIYKLKSALALVARHSILDIKSETSGLNKYSSIHESNRSGDLELYFMVM
jgi:hypothetical protein